MTRTEAVAAYRKAKETKRSADEAVAAGLDPVSPHGVRLLSEARHAEMVLGRVAARALEMFLAAEPRQPEPPTSITLIITKGAGGDEAAEFVRLLTGMYVAYCRRNQLSCVPEPGAPFVSRLVISGIGAGALLVERGVHRIQRVPESDQQGRIHTSTALVTALTSNGDPYPLEEAKVRTYNFPTRLVHDHRTGAICTTVDAMAGAIEGIMPGGADEES